MSCMSETSRPPRRPARATARHEHPSHAMAIDGRRLVRPPLAPGDSVAVAHPRRAMALDVVRAAAARAHNGGATDVVVEGFHGTSSRSVNPSWYQILTQNAARIREAPFDHVWFPPPSASVDDEGYLPTRWLELESSYGTRAELEAAIAALRPTRAVADIVINHRCGVATAGADFDDPPFPRQTDAVCRDDESGVGTGALDTGENQIAPRDLDHTDPGVQSAVQEYLDELKQAGFSGWRFDEARGYAGAFVGLYNDVSHPILSVGEFWDANRQNVMDWIDATGGRSMAFDFPTRTPLKAAIPDREFWRPDARGPPARAA